MVRRESAATMDALAPARGARAERTGWVLASLAIAFAWTDAAQAHYGSGYRYCRRLTIDSALVAGASPHTDIPVLVAITHPDLRTVSGGGHVENASGFDIIFVDATEAIQLDHEIASYDGPAGTIEMWVRIPSLSASVDTDFHIYYGNPAIVASQENVSGVWQSGFEAVYHFDGDLLDASGSGRHGTDGGSADTAGIAGRARDFTPVAEVRVGTWSVSGSSITLEAWVRYDDFDQDDPRVISKATTRNEQDHVFMLGAGETNEDKPRGRVKTGTDDAAGTTTLFDAGTPLGPGVWIHRSLTYDGSDMRLFNDGVELTSTSKAGALRENAWAIYIGNNPNNTDPANVCHDGQIDEVRVSSVARSASWQLTGYNNLTNQGVGAGKFIEAMGPELGCIGLDLVKRAFLTDGTPVSPGTTLASGTVVNYMIYINNPGGARSDVSIRDVLDPAFAYQSGSIRIANPAGACASDVCTPAEEAALYAAVEAAAPSTDVVDADGTSIAGDTIDAGDQNVANAPVDLAADSVLALLFTIKIE